MNRKPPPDDLATELMELVDKDDSEVLMFDEEGNILVDTTIDSRIRAQRRRERNPGPPDPAHRDHEDGCDP